jgi:hypothetical protein
MFHLKNFQHPAMILNKVAETAPWDKARPLAIKINENVT